jgi:hypothetical protein
MSKAKSAIPITVLFVLLSCLGTLGASGQPSADQAPSPLSTGTGAFKVVNGKIQAPDGSNWIGAGVDVHDKNFVNAAANLPTQFPGINFVRVDIGGYEALPAPATYAAAIKKLTDQRIVVQLSDYGNSLGTGGGGNQGVIYTGSKLSTENNWFAAMGAYYKNNPYVWLGSNNEPSQCYPYTGGTAGGCPRGSSIYSSGPKTLSAWQRASYNAVRNSGNTSPFVLEPSGSRPPGWSGTPLQSNMDASYYATMTNIIWDPHAYWYQSGYSTVSARNDKEVAALISSAQSIHSADGVPPVVIGEYSGSGSGNGSTDYVRAVHASGVSTGAWVWDGSATLGGPCGDPTGLLSSNIYSCGVLTSPYGTAVKAHVLANSKATPAPSGCTASPNGTIIKPGSGTFCDGTHTYAITAADAATEDGNAIAGGGGTGKGEWYNKLVYFQDAKTGQWYTWNQSSFTAVAAPGG